MVEVMRPGENAKERMGVREVNNINDRSLWHIFIGGEEWLEIEIEADKW